MRFLGYIGSILVLISYSSVMYASSVTDQITKFNRTRFSSELLIAIATSESGLDPTKIGSTGDYGLFQVTELAYLDALGECTDLLKGTKFPASLLSIKWSTIIASCYIKAVDRRHAFRSTAELLAYYNCGSPCLRQVRSGRIRALNTTTKNYLLETLITYERVREEI